MKNSYKNIRKLIVPALFTGFLVACGGGGSSSSSSPTPPPSSSGPTWTAGVFAPSSDFEARCQNPRSGNDINGRPWPDVQGSTLEENHWLRSWSDETYLWYSEIPDQNPANFSNPITYFDTLKTNAVTASGNPQDQFHFTDDTDAYQQQASTGSSVGYGMRFRILQSAPPRQIVVAYNEPNSPASNANIDRGAEIVTIDGVDVANGSDVNTLNAGLFPSAVGESHTFEILDLGSSTTRTVTLTAENVTSDPVQKEAIINTPTGDVGYMQFNTFGTRIAEQELIDAFVDFSNQGIQDLVIDLRYNGGGFLFISSQLAYMVAGSAQTNNRIFETTVFNDKNPTTNPVTGETLSPTPFYNQPSDQATAPGGILPDVNLNRVFILSTSSTCSASEALINGLRGIDVEVILIGGTTCGKPYGFYPTDNCGTTYFTIQFRGENNKGWGDYADGFVPSATDDGFGNVIGCSVADDFSHQLGDPNEAMLAAALDYRTSGACPVVKSQAEPRRYDWSQNPLDLRNSAYYQKQMFYQQNRIDLNLK
ncbi:S41 family peptidase [Kangiella sp. TOML190]|uniref:S41 family peptidase n=1 Tax=Kangiella sp. TOML190 TaxID=2931351 RepID=UPI00203E79A6|nr:S41 family peptidase [Kangiella sp. TOML190]